MPFGPKLEMSVLLDGFYSKGHVSSDSDVVAAVLYTVFVLTMMLKVISSKCQEVCCRVAVHYLIFYFWKPFCSDILLWQHLL